MLKIVLIGLGNMGKLHLKNIKNLQNEGICKLVCVCDKDKVITKKISTDLGIDGCYSVEEMLESIQFDVAIIAITSSEHFKVAKILIENNKPLLIEKPVVTTIEHAQELFELSNKKNILVSPGYTEVYNSVVNGIKSYFDKGQSLNYIDFYRIGQKSTRNDIKDIDTIQDLMTHDLAVLSQFINIDNIKNISGNTSSYNKKSNMYDLSNVNLYFENGLTARFLCDRESSVKIRKFNVSTEEMYAEFNYMDQTANIMTKGNINAFGNNIWYSQNYDAIKIRYSNNPLYDELKDFILSVQNQKETIVSEQWFKITKTIEIIRNSVYNGIQ